VTREIADFAATQMKGTIEEDGATTRQLLEDVQASLHDSIAGEAILKCYTDETRQQFAGVIKSLIEEVLTRAMTLAQGRMDEWVKETLEHSMAGAQKALSAANNDFKNKLSGTWGRLLWACVCCGVLASLLLVTGGFWLGRHW